MPKNCSIFDISKEKNCKQSKTADLASLLELKVNAGLMKTTNLDISDRFNVR